MRLTFLFILLSLVPLPQASADTTKLALILGAAGDPPGPTTIFDPSLKPMADKLAEGKYQVDVAFDGGHEITEKLLASTFNATDQFTAVNANAKIDQMAEKISKLHEGDQVLIVLDTHGMPASDKTSTHGVIVGTGSSLAILDTGSFEKLQIAAEKRGVKLAIVDASCFSGASLNLVKKHPSTCILTAASANVYGWSSFVPQLMAQLKVGIDLNSAFIQTRNSEMIGYPQTSSPKGIYAQSTLDSLTSNTNASAYMPMGFMVDKEGHAIVVPTVEKKACEVEENLKTQIPQMLSVLEKSYGIDPAKIAKLKNAVSSYQDVFRQTVSDEDFMNELVNFEGRRMQRRSLIDIDDYLSSLKRMINNPALSPELKSAFQANVDDEAKLRRAHDQVMKDERVIRYMQVVKPNGFQPGVNLPLQHASADLANAERSIYNDLFNQYKSKGADACADFKF